MYQYLLLLDTDQERDFFQMLYDRYKNDMYYTAYRILQNRADEEDIVHETFLTLTENLVKIMGDPPQKNRNYILTIVKNKCYNLYKKKKREIDADMEQERPDLVFPEGLDERLERMEKKELILKLIKEMKQSYQDVLLMQYYHEMGTDEIAKIMNTTPDNIRHISKRAKEKLQIMLKKYGISE